MKVAQILVQEYIGHKGDNHQVAEISDSSCEHIQQHKGDNLLIPHEQHKGDNLLIPHETREDGQFVTYESAETKRELQ